MRIRDWSSDVCSSDLTPRSALYLGKLVNEAGFPPGVINLVNGPGETVGDAIVAHRGIDKLAFTGSGVTAKIIQRRAADTLKRCTFELGGKSPIVVFPDADLEAAVDGAYSATFWHARSEEHTSELQSLMRIPYAVFCLKKKTIY